MFLWNHFHWPIIDYSIQFPVQVFSFCLSIQTTRCPWNHSGWTIIGWSSQFPLLTRLFDTLPLRNRKQDGWIDDLTKISWSNIWLIQSIIQLVVGPPFHSFLAVSLLRLVFSASCDWRELSRSVTVTPSICRVNPGSCGLVWQSELCFALKIPCIIYYVRQCALIL